MPSPFTSLFYKIFFFKFAKRLAFSCYSSLNALGDESDFFIILLYFILSLWVFIHDSNSFKTSFDAFLYSIYLSFSFIGFLVFLISSILLSSFGSGYYSNSTYLFQLSNNTYISPKNILYIGSDLSFSLIFFSKTDNDF